MKLSFAEKMVASICVSGLKGNIDVVLSAVDAGRCRPFPDTIVQTFALGVHGLAIVCMRRIVVAAMEEEILITP